MSQLSPCLLLLLIGCGGATPCARSAGDLPASSRPPASISDAPWTDVEQAAADAAVRGGFDEIANYFDAHPEVIPELWDNSVEAFLDVAYAADRTPGLRDAGLTRATDALHTIAGPSLSVAPSCDEVGTLLTLLVYAHTLHARRPTAGLATLRASLLDLSNRSLTDCGGLAAVLGADPVARFGDPALPNPEVYGYVMWSITLLDAATIDGLHLPDGVADFVGRLWAYLGRYPLPAAADATDGANDLAVYDTAYLVTHVAYLPTGYGRHRLYVADAPWLHRYLRENFYAVLAMGELDLVAEFVDLFRQYGCSEENDRQLRDGSRHLLRLYAAAGDRWMAHRESYETAQSNPYDLLHKPWTAVAGLRRRRFEPLVPGSYGAMARDAIRR
jgi:hypothetical protein